MNGVMTETEWQDIGLLVFLFAIYFYTYDDPAAMVRLTYWGA